MKKVMLSTGLLMLFGITLHAAEAAGTGMAMATIIEPITISDGSADEATALNFGQIIPSATAEGRVTIAPTNGAVPSTAGDGLQVANTAAAQPGKLTVTVDGNTTITATGPASVSLTGDPAGTLTLENVTTNCPSSSGCTVTADTPFDLFYGGELVVPASQAAGDYTSTIPITVTY